MRWAIAAVFVVAVLVVFRGVPLIGAIDNLLLAVANVLSAIGNLLVRFTP